MSALKQCEHRSAIVVDVVSDRIESVCMCVGAVDAIRTWNIVDVGHFYHALQIDVQKWHNRRYRMRKRREHTGTCIA